MARRGARTKEHRRLVDPEQQVPGLGRQILALLAARGAGVVDQDIDTAERRRDLVEYRIDARLVADVADPGAGLATGIDIATGDYVIADRDGAVIVPEDRAEEVIAKAEASVASEDKVRAAILDGVDPKDAYLKFGKF